MTTQTTTSPFLTAHGRAEIIERVCNALPSLICKAPGELDAARAILNEEYPFEIPDGRAYKIVKSINPEEERKEPEELGFFARFNAYDREHTVFMRDGFVDRYTGQKLVYPSVLRLLSDLMPDEFPYHRHGKLGKIHFAYWELCPSMDHIHPRKLGGKGHFSNLATTSYINNQIKSNRTLGQMGELLARGNLDEWDGLMGWFRQYVSDNHSVEYNGVRP